jgi:mono/diheme cytochrome c family protein
MARRLALVMCAVVILACSGCYKADVEHGAALFRKNCAGCHVPRPGQTTYVPSLARYFDRKPRPSERQTRKTIRNERRYMPPFKIRLSDHDIDDLIAYLRAQR